MTPAEIIADARHVIQDTLVPYRFTDEEMLSFVNLALKRMAVLRPDLFAELGELTTTPNTPIQTIPTDGIRLIDIFYVQDGDAVLEADRESLSRSYPGWATEAAGTPINFMRHVKNGEKYFLYPKPEAGIVLVGEYAKTPPDYDLNDTITSPPQAFKPVIIDGAVYMAESVDAEHVNSGRAKLYFDSFTSALGASLQSHTVTDTKAAGLKPSSTTAKIGEVI